MNNTNNSNKKRHHHSHNHNHNKNRNRQRFTAERPSINKVYDSNGPSGRQRGNASTLYEKYTTLARDAHSAGDRVLSENFMQYAEHYLRIVNSIQEQMQSVYRDSYSDTEQNHDEQSYHSDGQPQSAYSEPHYNHDTERHSQPMERTDIQPSHFDKPESSFVPEETAKDKPMMRRKMYPYARRKPYDASYNQNNNYNQNTEQPSQGESYLPKNSVPVSPPLEVAPEIITPNIPMTSEIPIEKPRRVVRRRSVTQEPTKNQSSE